MFNFQNPSAAPNISQAAMDFYDPTKNAMAMFGGGMFNYVDPSGRQVIQAPQNGNSGGADFQPGQTANYYVAPYRAQGDGFQFGDIADRYDAAGNYEASANVKDASSSLDTLGPLIVGGMALAGAGGFLGGGGVGGAGGGALTGVDAAMADLAASGGLTPSAMGVGGTGAMGAGAGAGFLGDATAAGYAGLDAASAATLGGGASVGGGTVLGAGGLGAAGLTAAGGAGGAGAAAAGGLGGYLGPLATVAGGLLGSQGQDASSSSTRAMDPRMDSLFYNDLAPRTQQTLAGQMGAAQGAGSQMLQVGSGLLGRTAPDTATNPYATGILDDMERRYNDVIAQRLQQVKGNSVGVGGLGGSRQGVAEAQAITQGADNFAGQGLNFMGGLYTGDQNRLLQQQTLGAGLISQGLNTPFQPLQQTAQIYSPFSGFGSTTNSSESGGGWGGALGGALGAAQLGKNMGWWGDSGTSSGFGRGASSAGNYLGGLF